jgi:hypothetical protein
MAHTSLGGKKDQMIGKIFDSLTRYWPSHCGNFAVTILPVFGASDKGAAVAKGFKIQSQHCTHEAMDPTSEECRKCSNVRSSKPLCLHIAAWGMIHDVLEFYSLLISNEDTRLDYVVDLLFSKVRRYKTKQLSMCKNKTKRFFQVSTFMGLLSFMFFR